MSQSKSSVPENVKNIRSVLLSVKVHQQNSSEVRGLLPLSGRLMIGMIQIVGVPAKNDSAFVRLCYKSVFCPKQVASSLNGDGRIEYPNLDKRIKPG